ncbi:MAG: periplasmic-type flagellar collar protein FlbB [bacterium]
MNIHSEDAQTGLSIFLFLVLTGLIATGLYMLDTIGLVDVRNQAVRYLSETPYVGQFVQQRPVSQEAFQTQKLRQLQEKIQKKRNKLQEKRQEIKQQRQELKSKRQALNRTEETLEQRENALEERKSRFESREARTEYLADLYSNMPPNASATRLEGIRSDRIVISILRKMETSTSSIILSNMDPARSAQLTRKMANYPGG